MVGQADRTQIERWLKEGHALARAGQRGRARQAFRRVLAHEPDNVQALVWLAGVEHDPRQSLVYLRRALQLDPNNADAQRGLRWAEEQLATRTPARQPAASSDITAWLDDLLLACLAAGALLAAVILIWAVIQAPQVVRAAYAPTATPTPSPTPTHTPWPTFTPTPAPTSTPEPTPAATPTAAPAVTPVVPGEPSRYTPHGEKWIQIDLSEQRLTAYEGETAVFSALVSTGVASMPTPKGEHAIYLKVRSQAMGGQGYYLPNVQYVSYFYKDYALHGTYWHNNFGHPMSHGCVNLTNDDAQWIFEWAPVGTRVVVVD